MLILISSREFKVHFDKIKKKERINEEFNCKIFLTAAWFHVIGMNIILPLGTIHQ